MFKGIYNKQTLTRSFDVIKHYLHTGLNNLNFFLNVRLLVS